MTDEHHVWAATSGWDGPFQHEEVIVIAANLDDARRMAEAAFAAVVQPVCRARMRIADLGPVRPGPIGRPRRGGQLLAADGVEVPLRCGGDDEPTA